MDVSKISENGIKIKSKLALFGVNPQNGKGNITVDAVLLFDNTTNKKQLSLEGEPLIINGPGEYEMKGTKLSGIGKNNGVVYVGRIDSMHVCIYRSSAITNTKDAIEECEIAIIDADIPVDQKILAAMNVHVAVLYGMHAQESVKAFGKDVSSVAKCSITKERLPQEMEIILLL